jgi:hypothetical protein
MGIVVDPIEAEHILSFNLRANLPTMMKGSPGTGKSSIVKALAKEYNLKLIDLRLAQCDPTDLLGFPYIDPDTNRARYVPMATFPLEGDDLPLDDNGQQMEGWLLFLDEMNSADKAVQKGSYKLILDREVGDRKLHSRVRIIGAGNLDTDGAIVETQSTAMQSRICHLTIRPDHKAWLAWARKAGFDYRITSFIEFKPTMLYTFDPEKAEAQETYACYRTWEFADKQLKLIPDIDSEKSALALFTGSLGEGVAREFMAYLRSMGKMPKFKAIIAAPTTAPLPKEPGVMYAMAGSLGANAEKTNIDPVITYTQRLPMEFQVITLREILRRDETLMNTTAVMTWIDQHGKEFAQL